MGFSYHHKALPLFLRLSNHFGIFCLHLKLIFTCQGFSRKTDEETLDVLLQNETSSLIGYLYTRKRDDFVNYEHVLDYIGGDNRKGRQGYSRFIQWGIKQRTKNPLELGKGNGIIGEADFVKWIKKKFLSKDTSKREQPALRELRKEFKPEELIEHFTDLVGKRKEDICQRGKRTIERSMLMEFLYRFCHITQPEIGRLVGGIDYSAVSQARKRLRMMLEEKPKLKKRFYKLSDQLHQLSRGKI